YPLFPVFATTSAVLVLLVFVTSITRQSWNRGLLFLCFWLFWQNLTLGIDAIVWADNADLRAYVYCDIVSHLHIFLTVVQPCCTLIITRRLYMIVSMRCVKPQSRRQVLIISIFCISAEGVADYVVQGARFVIYEGLGCSEASDGSFLNLLLINSWSVIFPAISALFYSRIVYVFYRYIRETNEFLRSNDSVSRPSYLRLLILGCFDILILLPFGIFTIVQDSIIILTGQGPPNTFYQGRDLIHSDWGPVSVSYDSLVHSSTGNWALVNHYFQPWSTVVLALAIFGIFGFTAQARATYWGWICAVRKPFG
ncbi:GPCR fungal pheromone mating factor, partial [Vararia minispora EC-137]